MSLNISISSKDKDPSWFLDLLGLKSIPKEGETISTTGTSLLLKDGILRADSFVSDNQKQTEEVFGFKWHQTNTFESDAAQKAMLEWALSRYRSAEQWFPPRPEGYTVLDAGCGAAYTGLLYFKPIFDRIRYLGADISAAVNVAKNRMRTEGADCAFLQCDLTRLPFQPSSFDAIFSEGVLHHTDSTRGAIHALAPLLKSGGLFMFYVYRKKGPIREFTDDYIREKLQHMTPKEGWKAVEPLTRIGQLLGSLNIELDIPERVDLLDIDPGKISLQRFFYWNIFKCFYRSDYTLDEMNHINFDWYAPRNAFRQSPEDVRQWCAEAGLSIVHEVVEEAGITMVTRKN